MYTCQVQCTYLVEDIFESELRQSRALDILDCTQLSGHSLTSLLANRLHLLLRQFFLDSSIVAQVSLRANNQARHSRAVMVDFGKPFLAHVLEGSW